MSAAETLGAVEVQGHIAETECVLSGWGRTAPSRAWLARPRHADDLERALADANGGVIARGCGRSYGDAAQNGGGRVIDMTGLRDIVALDLEQGLLTARAGATVGQLLRVLLGRGWTLPVVPGTQHVTLGGAVASDIHGKNHHGDGSFARHVVSLTLRTPAGSVIEAGPEHEPEVFNATVGGMGLTGVVLELTLRLLRVAGPAIEVDTDRTRDLDETLALLAADAHRYSVAWVDLLAGGGALGRGVVMGGEHVAGPGEGLRSQPHRVSVPRRWPGGVLRPGAVRAFNELYWRRAPRRERGRTVELEHHFFPLDAIGDWNRLYGPGGLLQYQLVVPHGEERALRIAVERLRAARVPGYLAVLKRFGAAGDGMLSFPLAGWTLAIDVPATAPGVHAALDELDQLVAGANGRVYLAKDARLRRDVLTAMYPKLARWREARARLDPKGVMRSDLARRLGLDDTDAS